MFETFYTLIRSLRRTIIFIPLLPDNEIFRHRAIKFVDEHLQFSLYKLNLHKYTDCTADVENSSFFS